MTLTVTFRVLWLLLFFSNETKKINKGRWKGALLAEVGHVSVLSLLVSWWWAVSKLDSCSQRGGGKACTHTCRRTVHLLACPCPLWSLTPAIPDSLSHTHVCTDTGRATRGWFCMRAGRQVIASQMEKSCSFCERGYRSEFTSAVLSHSGGTPQLAYFVLFVFFLLCFTSADGWGEVRTCFLRWDIWQLRCLGSLKECVVRMWRGVSKIFVLLRCLRWTLFSAMPGMCPVCPPIH